MSLVDRMVRRFLQWRLPDDFAPDGRISFDRPPEGPAYPHWPVGTNLLTYNQATEMVRDMLVGEILAVDAVETTPRQRVEQELAQLEDRMEKLRAFIPRAKIHHMPEVLAIQLEHMTRYSNILRARLGAWREE